MLIKVGRGGMVVLTCWIQPPFQDVPGDHERSRDDAIPGNLRIGADVDQGRPSTHRMQCLSRIEPGQEALRVCQKLINRGPRHGAS